MKHYGTINNTHSIATKAYVDQSSGTGGDDGTGDGCSCEDKGYNIYDLVGNHNIVVGKSITKTSQKYLWYFCDHGRRIWIRDPDAVNKTVFVDGNEYDVVQFQFHTKQYMVDIEFDVPTVCRLVKYADNEYRIETKKLACMEYQTRCPGVFIDNLRGTIPECNIVCRRFPSSIPSDPKYATRRSSYSSSHELYVKRKIHPPIERLSEDRYIRKYFRLCYSRWAVREKRNKLKSFRKNGFWIKIVPIAKKRWKSCLYAERGFYRNKWYDK